MKRIVLDTNVVVSGLLWTGRPRELLVLGRAQEVRLFTSLQLLNELGDTLARPKFAPKFAGIGNSPAALVLGYASLAETVACSALAQPVAPDPDDDWVLATALAARADLIVTGDKPLLDVSALEQTKIVGVGEALTIIAAS